MQQPHEGGWEEQGMVRSMWNQFCCCCWWNLKGKRLKNQWVHEKKQYKNSNFNFIGAFIIHVVKQLLVYTHRVWRFLFSCVKKQKSEKQLSSEQCTWCLPTVKNFWYKIVWKEFAANQHFKVLCMEQRQSSGALTSGKCGWNFTSDVLENPSLVILVLKFV